MPRSDIKTTIELLEGRDWTTVPSSLLGEVVKVEFTRTGSQTEALRLTYADGRRVLLAALPDGYDGETEIRITELEPILSRTEHP